MIFAVIHRPGGDSVSAYGGMDTATIETMLTNQGLKFDFISEQEYQNFISSNTPITRLPDPRKTQAELDAKNSLKLPTERIDAIITILGI
jgi:hypothetical protein